MIKLSDIQPPTIIRHRGGHAKISYFGKSFHFRSKSICGMSSTGCCIGTRKSWGLYAHTVPLTAISLIGTSHTITEVTEDEEEIVWH